MNYQDLEKRYNFKGFYKEIVKVDLNYIPDDLHFFKPYIEFFVSVSAEEREAFMEIAPLIALQDLESLMENNNVDIYLWLGDPEASVFPYSNEYLFMSMLTYMAMDYKVFRKDI
jgi:hypothetical protein